MDVPIVVSEDNINVASFTDQIDLSVDVGPQGERGTRIFSGTGAPAPQLGPTLQGIDLISNDYYIDLAPPGYAWLYRFDPSPVGWNVVGRVGPGLYVGRHTLTFTTGAATVSVPLVNIIGQTTFPAGLSVANLVPQVTGIISTGATANMFALGISSLTLNGTNIDVVIHGRTLSTTAVSQTSGSVEVSLGIAVKP
jgi:hypothetical protein